MANPNDSIALVKLLGQLNPELLTALETIAGAGAVPTAVEQPRLNAGPLPKRSNPAPAAAPQRQPVKQAPAPAQAQSTARALGTAPAPLTSREPVVQIAIIVDGVTLQTLTSTGVRTFSSGNVGHNVNGKVQVNGTTFQLGCNLVAKKAK